MEEQEKKEEKSKETKCEIKEKIEELMEYIVKQGIDTENIDFLSKIMDIHKDISNEEYWKEKINMRYRGYSEGGSMGGYSESGSMGAYSEGSYGRRGVPGSGRGRYSEGGSYGRRGVKGTGRGRYRGEEMMDEMMFHYGNYSESGQYGAEGETMEALSNLMESAFEYFKNLKENANSQDEIKMMEHYFKKMGQM